MNLFIKLLLLALIAALAAPFFLRGPDGRPLWTPADFTTDIDTARRSVRRLVDAIDLPGLDQDEDAPGETTAESASGHTIVHRWQDEAGVWHFASEPPQGIATEVVQIDPDANLVQGFAATSADAATDATQPVPAIPASSLPGGGALPNPAELAQEAEAIREASEARNATLEALRRGQ